MIEKISKADGSHTIGANVVFHTTGIMRSNDNIANLSGLCNDLEKIDKIKNKIPQRKWLIIWRKRIQSYGVISWQEKNQRIILCQSDSRMQWMKLPPHEKLELEKFVNGQCNILHVGKE